MYSTSELHSHGDNLLILMTCVDKGKRPLTYSRNFSVSKIQRFSQKKTSNNCFAKFDFSDFSIIVSSNTLYLSGLWGVPNFSEPKNFVYDSKIRSSLKFQLTCTRYDSIPLLLSHFDNDKIKANALHWTFNGDIFIETWRVRC